MGSLDPSSSSSSRQSWWDGHRGPIMIARVVGIVCVASGFILGIHGLDDPDSFLLPTALGMIVAGVFAQVFALVKSVSPKSPKP